MFLFESEENRASNDEFDEEAHDLDGFHTISIQPISSRNRFQRLWAIYLKACGLSARAFDAIHALSLTVSHKWAANAYGILSERAMQEVRKVIQKSPFLISHDNVNMPLHVFSQRLHNQNHFIQVSATTATCYVRHVRTKGAMFFKQVSPRDTSLPFPIKIHQTL